MEFKARRHPAAQDAAVRFTPEASMAMVDAALAERMDVGCVVSDQLSHHGK
jgi:hypothetical protein